METFILFAGKNSVTLSLMSRVAISTFTISPSSTSWWELLVKKFSTGRGAQVDCKLWCPKEGRSIIGHFFPAMKQMDGNRNAHAFLESSNIWRYIELPSHSQSCSWYHSLLPLPSSWMLPARVPGPVPWLHHWTAQHKSSIDHCMQLNALEHRRETHYARKQSEL